MCDSTLFFDSILFMSAGFSIMAAMTINLYAIELIEKKQLSINKIASAKTYKNAV